MQGHKKVPNDTLLHTNSIDKDFARIRIKIGNAT